MKAARVGLVVALVLLAGWLVAPRENLVPEQRFDAKKLSQGIAAYLTADEARHANIRAGSEKQVIWAAEPEVQTEWSIVYLHGFSASSSELRPVPDRLAEHMGANLYFVRFAGHGQDGAALGQARAADWVYDVQEAIAIGQKIGKKTLVLSTSTGGSLATLAAADPEMSKRVSALVFVSPNYAVNNPAAFLLTQPGARVWVPWLIGSERSFTPQNDAHAAAWTQSYATEAIIPMAAVAKAARGLDHSQITQPALFIYAPEDQIVRSDISDEVRSNWGGDTTYFTPPLGDEDDPGKHVIAGEILSPEATPFVIDALVDWVSNLP